QKCQMILYPDAIRFGSVPISLICFRWLVESTSTTANEIPASCCSSVETKRPVTEPAIYVPRIRRICFTSRRKTDRLRLAPPKTNAFGLLQGSQSGGWLTVFSNLVDRLKNRSISLQRNGWN